MLLRGSWRHSLWTRGHRRCLTLPRGRWRHAFWTRGLRGGSDSSGRRWRHPLWTRGRRLGLTPFGSWGRHPLRLGGHLPKPFRRRPRTRPLFFRPWVPWRPTCGPGSPQDRALGPFHQKDSAGSLTLQSDVRWQHKGPPVLPRRQVHRQRPRPGQRLRQGPQGPLSRSVPGPPPRGVHPHLGADHLAPLDGTRGTRGPRAPAAAQQQDHQRWKRSEAHAGGNPSPFPPTPAQARSATHAK